MTFAIASSLVPDTFRAYVSESFGQEIKLHMDFPQELLGPTQMRLKVHAAALSPADYKIVEMGEKILSTAPTKENLFRLGFGVAGTLVEVGADVTKFKADDQVIAMAFFSETGSFVEYLVLDMKHLILMPKYLSFNHTAGLPLIRKTSYQLVQYGKLKKDDRVLILGGSSSTGSLAIQIANALGASYIAATTSSRNTELVKSFDADQSWNNVAQHVLKKDTGVFMTIIPHTKATEPSSGTTFYSFIASLASAELVELVKLVEAGQLTIPIDSVHPFENLLEAVKVQKTGHARGKIILQVLPEIAA